MKVLTKSIKILGVLIVVLLITWFAGPTASFEDVDTVLPTVDASIENLDQYLADRENGVQNIKPENESRIIWADSVRQTAYALVYLHGFSAGPMEGAPLHQEVASRYGMNLYLPRLSKHGIQDDDIFTELTPKALVDDAKEALVIGHKLGKKVILMSCSTGGTLAIYLLANNPDIAGHISYSANVSLFDPTAKMMTGPWGLQIVKKIIGDYREPAESPETPDSVLVNIRKYWYGKYRIEGMVALQGLIDMTMTEENFNKVSQPYFLGYFYKNDSAQDRTVSVDAILDFDSKTITSNEMKRVVAFENAGSHVINSPLTSMEYEGVREETYSFVEEILRIQPKSSLLDLSQN